MWRGAKIALKNVAHHGWATKNIFCSKALRDSKIASFFTPYLHRKIIAIYMFLTKMSLFKWNEGKNRINGTLVLEESKPV